MRRSNREPFTREEYEVWSQDVAKLEEEIRACAIHAGFSYGQLVEDRGKRIETMLRTYRDYVRKLAFNKISDAKQHELEWDT